MGEAIHVDRQRVVSAMRKHQTLVDADERATAEAREFEEQDKIERERRDREFKAQQDEKGRAR